MRFILSLIIWFTLVGGLYGYTQIRDQSRMVSIEQQTQVTDATGEYSLRLTPTFSVERDPFALTTEIENTTGFELWLNGKRITIDVENLHQGTAMMVEKIPGLIEGGNEIFVKASPPVSGDMDHYAMRVELLENGSVILEETMWSSGGAQVSGTMTVNLGKEEKDEHDH